MDPATIQAAEDQARQHWYHILNEGVEQPDVYARTYARAADFLRALACKRYSVKFDAERPRETLAAFNAHDLRLVINVVYHEAVSLVITPGVSVVPDLPDLKGYVDAYLANSVPDPLLARPTHLLLVLARKDIDSMTSGELFRWWLAYGRFKLPPDWNDPQDAAEFITLVDPYGLTPAV